MHLLPSALCVEMAGLIPVLVDVKITIEITGFFLSGSLPFQRSHHV